MLTHCTAVKSRGKDDTSFSECSEMTGIRGRKGLDIRCVIGREQKIC